MPPRLNLFSARTAVPVFRHFPPRRCIATTVRSDASHALKSGLQSSINVQQRWNSSGSAGVKSPEEAKRSAESMPHVSEEAAEINKIMDKKCEGTPSSPELEQGTPVSEILKRDTEAQKHAPKVFQDQLKKGPSGSRFFSTSARRAQLENQKGAARDSADQASAALVESMITQVTREAAELEQLAPGLKFPAPESLPRTENYRKRYEPLLDQFTKQLMRDGKLSMAQKNMAFILDHLRSSSPPQTNPRRRLLAGGPPTPQLPLNPILYLTLIVDSVAPLMRLRQVKGIIGGGASVQIPVPLAERQRRRFAIRWIIDASDKRRDAQFAQRVANELIAVAEGRSGVWERRDLAHKLAVAGRANVGVRPRMKSMNVK